ncbi:MAG TPA: tyrosine-type recombinase/integrase [Acidimicrobiales bacterium]|nr:tyrosine-type recombinase/integrase [Acidimicrobiales bacterium]
MVRKASPVCVTGPLAAHADGFHSELSGRGYTPLSAANQLRVMAHLSRWLADQALSLDELTVERVEAFLAARRVEGYTCWLSQRGLAPLLAYLRGQDVVPAPPPVVPVTPLEALLADYRSYLVKERGLVAATVRNHENVARLFLAERCRVQGELGLEDLTAADVARFVVVECPKRSMGSAKVVVTGLRSLLGFLHVSGRVPVALASAVPAVAGWRGASLPRALPAAHVQRLLASCDRRRGVGRRDFAVLMLLARLGLRACEVAALELGDIDWRAGEVMVRGKGRRHELLPLPADVGQAIVGYLCRGRPSGTGHSLFQRVRAPHGPLSDGGVKAVVRNACDRAGLPRVGAHRLRHSAATEMLRAGARWTRSARCCATGAHRPRPSTPRSIGLPFGAWPCPGLEVGNERARPSRGELPRHPSGSGFQAGARRAAPGRLRGLVGTGELGHGHHRRGLGLGH